MFNIDSHTAEVLEGSRIVEVGDNGHLVVEKDGDTTDVSISGYALGRDEVVVEVSTIHRRQLQRVLDEEIP